MTRKQIVVKLDEVFSKGMYAGMVVFRSPVDGKLDERHIYSDYNGEVVLWLDEVGKFYLEHDIPFITYLNNRIYETFKLEITEEDCIDE